MKSMPHIELPKGGTIAVIGGGPAGAFFAIHLSRLAKQRGQNVRVVIFERRRRPMGGGAGECPSDCWKGCNYCAGGISPKLNDVLKEIGLPLPQEIVQIPIRALTIQGNWKNIEIDVPAGREMVSVYRGSRPSGRAERQRNFDSFLLSRAVDAGAELIAGEVHDVARQSDGRLRIQYAADSTEQACDADFVVFAAGVNESRGQDRATTTSAGLLSAMQRLCPNFQPPRLRRALIFEVEDNDVRLAALDGTIHFVEYGSRELPIEMCSIVPKRNYLTVTLVGPSIDRAETPAENMKAIHRFLDLPHIRKLLSPRARIHVACTCNPNLVIGSAKNAFSDRVAAVGDMVTTRLYKDGILSAERTAAALAETVLSCGLDAQCLERGYAPTLRRFRRDNKFAAVVFLLHRVFFGSSVLSRILYQAVITERKTKPRNHRRLEVLLWRIASGDDDYEQIFWSMLHPAALWRVIMGGTVVTLRNYITELCFGLRWEGFGRFTTGVALEELETKRQEFSRAMTQWHVPLAGPLEFERMYTIKIHAPRATVLNQLGQFGEDNRGYLRPRWVRVHRTAGEPNVPGCVITYDLFGGHLSFSLMLEQLAEEHVAVYRVMNGFAEGGVLIFEIEELGENHCALSIYLTFNFARGRRWYTRPFWWAFRRLFPDFAHDVVWNHSLCELKDVAEGGGTAGKVEEGQRRGEEAGTVGALHR